MNLNGTTKQTPNTGRQERPGRQRPRSGYVLLMTLVLITLAGLVLVGVARHSLRLSLEGVEAEEQLQRRWGSISVQRAILDRADPLLREHQRQVTSASNRPKQPTGILTARVPLGDMTFEFWLADEDAKINLNTLHRQIDQVKLRRQVGDLVGPNLPVLLRPFAPDQGSAGLSSSSQRPSGSHLFGSWGQVFPLDQLAQDQQEPSVLRASTSAMTCWGRGKLNVRRASPEAIDTIVPLAIGRQKTRRLVQFLDEQPTADLETIVDELDLKRREKFKLLRLITDRSSTYSLWMTVSSPQRQWHELVVAESAGSRSPNLITFVW